MHAQVCLVVTWYMRQHNRTIKEVTPAKKNDLNSTDRHSHPTKRCAHNHICFAPSNNFMWINHKPSFYNTKQTTALSSRLPYTAKDQLQGQDFSKRIYMQWSTTSEAHRFSGVSMNQSQVRHWSHSNCTYKIAVLKHAPNTGCHPFAFHRIYCFFGTRHALHHPCWDRDGHQDSEHAPDFSFQCYRPPSCRCIWSLRHLEVSPRGQTIAHDDCVFLKKTQLLLCSCYLRLIAIMWMRRIWRLRILV